MSFIVCLDRVRAHTSAKGVPSARVETLDNNDSYGNDVQSVRH